MDPEFSERKCERGFCRTSNDQEAKENLASER